MSLITIQNVNMYDSDKLDRILALMEKMMATLDQVLAAVTDESTQLDSLSTLIAGLKQQVADALAGTTLPAAVQAKVDAVFAQAETNKGKIATAISANTPAANIPPPAAGPPVPVPAPIAAQ